MGLARVGGFILSTFVTSARAVVLGADTRRVSAHAARWEGIASTSVNGAHLLVAKIARLRRHTCVLGFVGGENLT